MVMLFTEMRQISWGEIGDAIVHLANSKFVMFIEYPRRHQLSRWGIKSETQGRGQRWKYRLRRKKTLYIVFKAMRKDVIQKTRGDPCQIPEDSATI